MNQLTKTLAEDPAITTSPFAQSTVVPIDNEPTPRLIVEPPLPGPLAQGVVLIPYRVENVRILPVAGPAARNVSPRVGDLHITVDDLPWLWADRGRSAWAIVSSNRHPATRQGNFQCVPKPMSDAHDRQMTLAFRQIGVRSG